MYCSGKFETCGISSENVGKFKTFSESCQWACTIQGSLQQCNVTEKVKGTRNFEQQKVQETLSSKRYKKL